MNTLTIIIASLCIAVLIISIISYIGAVIEAIVNKKTTHYLLAVILIVISTIGLFLCYNL